MKLKTKSSSVKRAKPKKKKAAVSKCIAPGVQSCPLEGSDSPYQYQRGCRTPECRKANSEYYTAWREAKKAEAEVAERKAKRKAATKKRTAKK